MFKLGQARRNLARLRLDSFFALHPAMPSLHELYRHGHATIVHAVAAPYRDRSHFDGQGVLQIGAAKPGVLDTGWLTRAVIALAPAEDRSAWAGRAGDRAGYAVDHARARAGAVVGSVAGAVGHRRDYLAAPRHTDPAFARVLEERIGIAAIARAGGIDQTP